MQEKRAAEVIYDRAIVYDKNGNPIDTVFKDFSHLLKVNDQGRVNDDQIYDLIMALAIEDSTTEILRWAYSIDSDSQQYWDTVKNSFEIARDALIYIMTKKRI